MSKALLDTNILVDFLKKEPDKEVVAELKRQREEGRMFCTCDTVLTEFTAGLSPEQCQKVRSFLDDMRYLRSNRSVAYYGGQLYWYLYKQGKTTPLGDCFIATLAKYHRAVVITRDRKHFKNLSQWVEVNFV